MYKEFHVVVTPTSRRAGRGDTWSRWESIVSKHATLEDAKEHVRKNWETRTSSPIYRDTKRGTIKSGRVYSSTEREDGATYYRQNWVEIHEVNTKILT